MTSTIYRRLDKFCYPSCRTVQDQVCAMWCLHFQTETIIIYLLS